MTTWPLSPFRVGEWTDDPRLVVGRDEIIGEIRARLDAPQAALALVHGPRRFGKTSILRSVLRSLDTRRRVVAFADVRRVWDTRPDGWAEGELVAELVHVLLQDVASPLLLPETLVVPTSPNRLRRTTLPILTQALGNRRLVVAIDELEVLEEVQPGAVRELMAALEPRAGGPVVDRLLVWGRRFAGLPGDPGIHPGPLKDAAPFHLKLLEPKHLQQLVDNTFKEVGVEWPHAGDALFEASGGHPLFASALCGAVWTTRRALGTFHPIGGDDLVAAVADAREALTTPLRDLWDQLSVAGVVPALVLRALADLAPGPGGQTAPVPAIAAAIEDAGRAVDQDEIAVALDLLQKSAAVERSLRGGEACLISPVFGAWLSNEAGTLQYIVADVADRDRVRREAERAVEEARAAEAAGDNLAALRAYQLAAERMPSRWDAKVGAARIELRLARPEDALDRLRRVPQSTEVRRLRSEALVASAKAAREAGHPVDALVAELEALDPGHVAPAVDAFLVELRVDEWWAQLPRTPVHGWVPIGEKLVREAGAAWWPSAVERVAAALGASSPEFESPSVENDLHTWRLATVLLPWLARRAPTSATNPAHAIRDALTTLTASGISAEGPLGAQVAELQRLLAEAQHGDVPVATRAARALQAAWGTALDRVQTRLRLPEDIDRWPLRPEALLELVRAAPAHERRRLADVLRRLLRGLVRTALTNTAAEVAPLVRLATDLRDHALEVDVVEAAERLALEPPDDASALLEGWPQVVLALDLLGGDTLRREQLSARLADQLDLLLELARPEAFSALTSDELAAIREAWSRAIGVLIAAPTVDQHGAIERLVGPASGRPEPSTPEKPTERTVEQILGSAWRVGERVRHVIPGVQAVEARRVLDRRGDEFLARIYRLRRELGPMRDFVDRLWHSEFRVLSDVGTHSDGRALPALRDAWTEEDGTSLVLITEWLGITTLREYLDAQRLRSDMRESPSRTWRQLTQLVRTVAALHERGFLHRNVRPEAVLCDPSPVSSARFRLTGFEHGVWLHALDDGTPLPRSIDDHYHPPEVVAAAHGDGAGAEGRGTDTYGLGLLLFEAAVRPLTPTEREFAPQSWTPSSHRRFLDGLLAEAQEAKDRDWIPAQALRLLSRLLVADPDARCADLREVLPLAELLAYGADEVQDTFDRHPALCVTVLGMEGDASIARWLNQHADVDPLTSREETARFLDEDLRGARVYRNARADRAPLVVVGRRARYTVQRFVFDDRAEAGFGWLEVARDQDRPNGEQLATLTKGAHLLNVHAGMDLFGPRGRGASWEPLFTSLDEYVDVYDRESRHMHALLRLMTDLEEDVARDSVLPIEVVDHTPAAPGGRETVRIRIGRGWGQDRRDLPDRLAQWFERESHFFSLDPGGEPFATFEPGRRWMLQTPGGKGLEPENWAPLKTTTLEEAASPGDAVLWRISSPTNEDPRGARYVRPYALQGGRTLHSRHRAAVDELRYDPYLLGALARPSDRATVLDTTIVPWFDHSLDGPKRTLAEAIHTRRPLFSVQGPPGTGKTTLAREVVLQTLSKTPHARILVTSQSHDPLNNLLEKVEAGLDQLRPTTVKDADAWRRPLAVRLMNEERLLRSTAEGEGARLGQEFHPTRQAERVLAAAERWLAEDAKQDWREGAPQLRASWARFLAEQKALGLAESLEKRITASASIVFATANDRRLSEMRPGSFDLVIYEEAGKSYPVELVGPLRLARRWLLIGDQDQLPPYDLRSYDNAFTKLLERNREGHAEGSTTPAHVRLGCKTEHELRSRFNERLRMFGYLYDAGVGVKELPHAQPVLFGLSGRLTKQWRMHPAIGELVRKQFYPFLENGDPDLLRKVKRHQLKSPAPLRDRALVWIDIPHVTRDFLAGDEPGRGGGYVNPFEARALQGFMRDLAGKPMSTVVLSPYRAQVALLQELLETWDHPVTGPMADHLHTIDSFQGRQAEMVILSLVRNNDNGVNPRYGIGFLADRNRANVMFSRAERLLVVVGCSQHFARFDHDASWIHKVYRHIADDPEGLLLDGREFLRPQDDDRMREQYERRQRQREAR